MLLLIKVAPSRVSLDVVAAVHLCGKRSVLIAPPENDFFPRLSPPFRAYQRCSRAAIIVVIRATGVRMRPGLTLGPYPRVLETVFRDWKNCEIWPSSSTSLLSSPLLLYLSLSLLLL